MLRIPLEWYEFAFECFEFLSNGLNLRSNASNPFRIFRICIKSRSKGLNLIFNMVRIL